MIQEEIMSHAITLTLPDRLYDPIRRIAQATNQPLETVLLIALQASLPPLDGLTAEMADELRRLEELDNEALRAVMFEIAPKTEQHEVEDLLETNRTGVLTDVERERLLAIQRAADGVMLRRARAAVLLRFRGQHIPTAAEMRERLAKAG
jgi:ribosomal protein S13